MIFFFKKKTRMQVLDKSKKNEIIFRTLVLKLDFLIK